MRYRYADAHCDTAYEMLQKGCELDDNPLHISLSQAGVFESYIQVFAAWTNDELTGAARADAFFDIAENFRRQVSRNSDRIALCLNGEDIARALSQGKIAAIFAIEGGGALNSDLSAIRRVFDAGVRMLTLTWNGQNELGFGQPEEGGLTDFGKKALRLMEDAGILADVSHLSERGFWDVCELARRPFLASHSNLKSVCQHPRNITDEQFKALVEAGGVCGINLCPLFLTGSSCADFESVERHIYRFLELGGEKSVVMGADFDGVTELPDGVSGLSSIPALMEYLAGRGYPQALVDAIFFGNLKDFLLRTLTKS